MLKRISKKYYKTQHRQMGSNKEQIYCDKRKTNKIWSFYQTQNITMERYKQTQIMFNFL